ncbi:MAG TPA: carboxypeptidase regulatory-like domain-containing protein [Vicinamibacterales bacterium]|nr:carboxypeptidase regulatory-like domain-containing protein [Vicinamibacterales bacterium]
MKTRRVSVRSWASVSVFAGLLALVFPGFDLIHAQTPQGSAASQAAGRLPVRRVVLYKSGVGYFEHLGKVRGNQTVTIDFTTGQLDDVLKSLTTLDLDGGRVLGVNYNSEAALDRRLGALRLPVGEQTTRTAFLSALRGAKLEVSSSGGRVLGRLLSVERTSDRRPDGSVTQVDTLSLVTDAGDLQTVALNPGVNVRIVEADLNQEVGRYLTLLASARDQDLRRLAISTSGNGERDLFVSYISEVPVWKATYRLVLPGATESRKPLLQGWAIVDNTVGEDWDSVELSLVAGAPQSFVQAISRPYYVQRPIVALPDRVSLAPQTHQAAMGTAGPGAIAGTVRDPSGGALPGVTVRAVGAGNAFVAVTNSAGRFELPSVSPGTYEITYTLAGFKVARRTNVLITGGFQAVVDQAMEIGQVFEEMTVTGAAPVNDVKNTTTGAGGGGGGRAGGGSFVAGMPSAAVPPPPPSAARVGEFRSAQQSAADAGQLGDLFEYKLREPVTIRKNQSALVPILSGEVGAEKVSLWNANSGMSRPLRAVWVTNTTGLTLDGGSFSVIEGQVFAGEGIVEPLKAGEKRLLSYAADLGVQVDAKGESVPSRVTRVMVARGLVTQLTEERQRRTYTARNEDTEPRTLVIEHPARAGWTIGGSLTPAETTSEWHRFKLSIAPKTSANFVVEETRQGQTQYSVNSITDDQISVLVRDNLITPQTAASLRQIQSQKAEVARIGNELAARQSEIDAISRDQDRVRENMKSLKGSTEEKQLLQRYVKQLDDQENRLEVLRRDNQKLIDDRQKAQAELNRLIENLSS